MQQLLRNKFVLVILGLIGIISIGAIILNADNVSNQKNSSSANPEPTIALEGSPVPTNAPEKPIAQQIIVKFTEGTSQATINQVAAKYNATVIKQISGVNLTVLKVAPGQEDAVVKQLSEEPSVQRVRREYQTHTQMTPNDPDYRLQWALKNTGTITINGTAGLAGADIEIEKAWDVTRGGGVKVAVIDTGIDPNHPDLAGKVVAQKAFGYSDIRDNQGHGTHVAGIIAANTNNGAGISGVCPDCKLIIAKALDANSAGAGVGTSQAAVEAIVWSADQGAKVINASFGTRTQSVIDDYTEAVNYAVQKGAVFVSAAGNDGNSTPFYPAASDNVISVAATDHLDRKATFSNYGSWVKVSAPGLMIYSTLPTYPHAQSTLKGTKLSYDAASGTSMASPVVAGVAALVWATPYGTSPTSVMNRVYQTTEKIQGTGSYWTHGRVNALAAVGNPPTARPTTGTIVPTLYCVGGAAQAPCATVPPTRTPTAVPGTGVTAQPTQPANPNPTATTNPCTTSQILGTADTPDTAVYTAKEKHNSGGGFFKAIFEFFFRLFEIIFRLITGAPPVTPTVPAPSAAPTAIPTPCPSTTITPEISQTPTIEPTAIPSSSASPSPTIEPTVQTPTNAPVTETPTVALTQTPTISASPTIDPCNDASTTTEKKHTKGSEDQQGTLASLIQKLIELIQRLLDLLSGKQPTEEPSPSPTPTPCP